MVITAWIAFGLVANILTKLILGGKDSASLILTTCFGIAGAVIGSFISMPFFNFDAVREFNLGGMVIAIIGSVLVLLIYRLSSKRSGCAMITQE